MGRLKIDSLIMSLESLGRKDTTKSLYKMSLGQADMPKRLFINIYKMCIVVDMALYTKVMRVNIK
jgi:hypothetical protein